MMSNGEMKRGKMRHGETGAAMARARMTRI
jgi:hypothetical protein